MLYLYLEVILRRNTWSSIFDFYYYKLFLIYIATQRVYIVHNTS